MKEALTSLTVLHHLILFNPRLFTVAAAQKTKGGQTETEVSSTCFE